jgi:hypothetical protein
MVYHRRGRVKLAGVDRKDELPGDVAPLDPASPGTVNERATARGATTVLWKNAPEAGNAAAVSAANRRRLFE